ncbi:hypothetical protein KY285_036363 [Solanum tuberosum]|nr:hypothetical protein KY285_036363 [Solanum tuberosum]
MGNSRTLSNGAEPSCDAIPPSDNVKPRDGSSLQPVALVPAGSSPSGVGANRLCVSNQGPNIVATSSQGGGGGDNPDFRRNFRSMLDWHKPPLVALLETKMQNHQPLLEDFPFNRMIEVPAVGNSGGIVVLWDENILELDEIATTSQEVHDIIKTTAAG